MEMPNQFTPIHPEHVLNTQEARHMHGHQNFNHIHKRRNIPIYNDKADYDTNAQSYYDYLARVNEYLGILTDVVNKLFKRDLTTASTLSINMDKIGEWINSGECANMLNGDDVITITDFVKLTNETKTFEYKDTKVTLKNALQILGSAVTDSGKEGEYTKEGMYSKDYDDLFKSVIDRLIKIESDIENIKNEIINIWKEINNIKGDITNIKNDITNIYNELNKFKGGTVTVLKNHWDGKVTDGNTIPTTLTNGSYQIFIESPTVGSFSLRLPWAQSSDINQVQTGFSLPLSNQANGDFGFIKCTVNAGTAGVNPKIVFAETRYSKASGTTTVKNGNTDWYILIIKKEEQVKIG